jgi:hypothetical protein
MLLTTSLASGAGSHLVVEPELLVTAASIGVPSFFVVLNFAVRRFRKWSARAADRQ